MSLDANVAIVRRFMDAVYKGNFAVVDELMAPNFVEHTLEIHGRASMKHAVMLLKRGFPDLSVTIEDITADGDKVWDRITATGTHTGEYRGLAPTGRPVTLSGMRIWRILDGQLTERWSAYDFFTFFSQLGIIDYRGYPDERT